MSILDWMIGFAILGAILLYLVSFLWEAVPFFTVDAYRHLRYTRKGICYKCKRPFQGYAVSQVDQMYSSQVKVPICDCKDTRYVPMGNRHPAEW